MKERVPSVSNVSGIGFRFRAKTIAMALMFVVGNLFQADYLQACTIFLLEGGDSQIVVKNHDFPAPDGYLIANKRNILKTAFVYLGQEPENPVQWISRYGSVTQNQYGRELPYGGINEAGLVVEMLMMPKTRYPTGGRVPTISQLQWVQYQLDLHAEVQEVVKNLNTLRIRPTPKAPGLHYFIADSKGDCAVIEFMNGAPTAYQGPSLPHKILTNSPYAQCLNSLKAGSPPEKDDWQSDARFIKTAGLLTRFDPQKYNAPIECAFATLSRIKWQAPNQWKLGYDLTHQRIYFQPKNKSFLRYIDLDSFDFTCTTPVQGVPIQVGAPGDAAGAITEFSGKHNSDLIRSTLSSFSLGPEANAEVFNHRTSYLEKETRCQE